MGLLERFSRFSHRGHNRPIPEICMVDSNLCSLDIAELHQRQRAFFDQRHTQDLAQRRIQLRQLPRAIKHYEPRLLAAVKADLGKGAVEGYFSEIGLVLGECRHALANLGRWTRPQFVPMALAQLPATCWVQREPRGQSLIIAPFNYPIMLALGPLVGALAAGDTAAIKPSEYTPTVAQVLAELVRETFAPEWVSVVQGDAAVVRQLLAQHWDFIFFTGSTHVGKIIAQAAAQHLTPCVLELGGKSPTIIAADADLERTAKRIVWGKWINAGQTCIAPDYVLVQRSVMPPLIDRLRETLRQFYGPDPQRDAGYGRIVNPRHVDRLAALMASGKVVHGGQIDRDDRFIAPTLLTDVALDSPIMQEEIFGPLLPIIAYDTLDEALAWINAKPIPLSLYVFSQDRAIQQRVLREVRSGNAAINDCTLQFGSLHLPFGGLGPSGMGQAHGKATFDAFSHQRSVLKRWPFDFGFRWLPYSPLAERIIRLVVR